MSRNCSISQQGLKWSLMVPHHKCQSPPVKFRMNKERKPITLPNRQCQPNKQGPTTPTWPIGDAFLIYNHVNFLSEFNHRTFCGNEAFQVLLSPILAQIRCSCNFKMSESAVPCHPIVPWCMPKTDGFTTNLC